MSLKVYLRQNNQKDSATYGRYYAFADNESPIDLVGLARHMADHNTPFSQGTIIGILRDMVNCIRELNLSGQPVKIDNLAIFSAHVENKKGWAALKDVELSIGNQASVIQSIRQCAQATGDFTKKELTKYGSLTLNREWRDKVADAKKTETDSGNSTDSDLPPAGTTGDDNTGGSNSGGSAGFETGDQ